MGERGELRPEGMMAEQGDEDRERLNQDIKEYVDRAAQFITLTSKKGPGVKRLLENFFNDPERVKDYLAGCIEGFSELARKRQYDIEETDAHSADKVKPSDDIGKRLGFVEVPEGTPERKNHEEDIQKFQTMVVEAQNLLERLK